VGQAQTTTAPDGRTLCFAEYGDLAGHPVISLHGTPGCRLLSPRSTALHLEGLLTSLGIRLIRYDRPGYGGSTRHPGRKVADAAADVDTIADVLGVARFAVEGGSGGSPPALAAAALLPERVARVALVAPLAPGLGSVSEDPDARLHRLAREAAEMRRQAASDPAAAAIFEATREGLWGWFDDELAAGGPWGFDSGRVSQRVQLWHDPADRVVPTAHANWLAENLRHAELRETGALGHGSTGDPRPDWRELYGWLAGA
jgi:pimeloyl-ACP methyl ester carboxylesterase